VTLTAGMLVMVDPTQPAQGQRLRVVRMNNNGTFPSDLFVGMVIETILANETGFVKWFGQVKKLSLSSLQPVGETWAEGDILWPNPSVLGGLTNVEPTAPSNKITVAAVLRITGNILNVMVRPNLRSKIADLHDVQLTTPTDGQVLRYDSGVWENDTLTASDVGAIPTTEKGVANGVATLDSDAFLTEAQMRINTTELRRLLAEHKYTAGSIIAWDDFRTDSATLAGATLPSGQVWDVVQDDGTPTASPNTISGGVAIVESIGITYRTSRIPVTGQTRGLTIRGLIGWKSSASFADNGISIYNGNDFIRLFIREDWSLQKVISGTATTITNIVSVNTPTRGTNVSLIFPFMMLVQKNGVSDTSVIISLEAGGNQRIFTVTDTDAINVLNNMTHIGIAHRVQSYMYGIKIIRNNL